MSQEVASQILKKRTTKSGRPFGGNAPTRNEKKEGRYRELVSLLKAKGVEVRREELKRGLGWRVVSGQCRLFTDRIVLVDRRLGQDEQIAVLEDALALLQTSA